MPPNRTARTRRYNSTDNPYGFMAWHIRPPFRRSYVEFSIYMATSCSCLHDSKYLAAARGCCPFFSKAKVCPQDKPLVCTLRILFPPRVYVIVFALLSVSATTADLSVSRSATPLKTKRHVKIETTSNNNVTDPDEDVTEDDNEDDDEDDVNQEEEREEEGEEEDEIK